MGPATRELHTHAHTRAHTHERKHASQTVSHPPVRCGLGAATAGGCDFAGRRTFAGPAMSTDLTLYLARDGTAKGLPGYGALFGVLQMMGATFADWLDEGNRGDYMKAANLTAPDCSLLTTLLNQQARRAASGAGAWPLPPPPLTHALLSGIEPQLQLPDMPGMPTALLRNRGLKNQEKGYTGAVRNPTLSSSNTNIAPWPFPSLMSGTVCFLCQSHPSWQCPTLQRCRSPWHQSPRLHLHQHLHLHRPPRRLRRRLPHRFRLRWPLCHPCPFPSPALRRWG
jgi:hypothetical protein